MFVSLAICMVFGLAIGLPAIHACNVLSRDTDLMIQDGYRKIDAERLEAARNGKILCMKSYATGIEKYVDRSVR